VADDVADEVKNNEETPKERIDRELGELLQGLRVAVVGVQVLFAFLLTVPFSARFAPAGPFRRTVFLITLLAAAASTVCFIAPAIQHRVLFRQRDKERLLQRSNRYGEAGAVFLIVAVTAAVLLVTDAVEARWLGAVVAAAVALGTGWAWLGQPWRARGQARRSR
jgi:O-antigen/teichoic acid export membrane protein